jgi:GTP-binding protein Era
MVIGAKGAMLKKIGQAAREDIERMTEKKVYLELFVKVLEDWTKDAQKLRELGILQK